jgi:hypothetical protein
MLLQLMPDPARLASALLRDEVQAGLIADSPAQGLVIIHRRELAGLGQRLIAPLEMPAALELRGAQHGRLES